MTLEPLFTDMRSLYTLVSFACFIGVAWWAYGARRAADFDAAARLPFADSADEAQTQDRQSGEKCDG